jgi:methyl-accepting chemotaxis protein
MYEDSIIDANIQKSRSLILAAEGVREYIAAQNESNVFQDSLTKLDDILKTVPIVGAMETARS